jgi:hypothetical protein
MLQLQAQQQQPQGQMLQFGVYHDTPSNHSSDPIMLASTAESQSELSSTNQRYDLVNNNDDKIIPEKIMPGGVLHCGGDLLFSGIKFNNKQVLFVMCPGSVVAFQSNKLMHGTTQHGHGGLCGGCCRASNNHEHSHISFAVQTPFRVLCKNKIFPQKINMEIVQCGKDDMHSINWVDAKIIKVVHIPPSTARSNLKYDNQSMIALPWQKIILIDQETNMPLVFYDYQGGLSQGSMEWCVKEFDFLKSHRFTLNRGSNALGEDKPGDQRMQMLGIRCQGRNKNKPRDLEHGHNFNENGDIDGYVIHWDNKNFEESKVEILVELLRIRMHAQLPTASQRLASELSQANIGERLVNKRSMRLLSHDYIVNNIGVSCTYQSPEHLDCSDVGWTFAFPCQCVHTE